MLGRSHRCSVAPSDVGSGVVLVHVPIWDPLDDSGGDSSAGSCVATAEAAAAAVAAA